MSLIKLSNELLLEIVKWASPTPNKQTLFNLALCSHRFNAITTPILYTSFDTGYEKGLLPVFLRTLVARPQLGLRVKSVSVKKRIGMKDNNPDNMNVYGIEDFERSHTAIKLICRTESEAQRWMYKLRTGNWHALVALMLFHLPNLRRLEIHGYKIPDPYL